MEQVTLGQYLHDESRAQRYGTLARVESARGLAHVERFDHVHCTWYYVRTQCGSLERWYRASDAHDVWQWLGTQWVDEPD